MGAWVLLATATVTAVAAVILAFLAVVIPPTRREQMLRALAAFGGGSVDKTRHTSAFVAAVRPPVVEAIQKVADALAPGDTRDRMQKHLQYAGNPPAWPLERVLRLRVITLAGGAIAGWILADVLELAPGLAGAAVGALIGLYGPETYFRRTGAKRQQALSRSMPDVLDALVIGVEAGLGMDSAMSQVAVMLRGPMPDEINRVLQEMKLGVARTEALRALSDRTTVRELKSLVTALVQAGELGISVAGILREHAHDQRLRRRQRAEEQAQKVSVKLLFPVLLCMFPAIFVIVIGPAALNLIKMFSSGF